MRSRWRGRFSSDDEPADTLLRVPNAVPSPRRPVPDRTGAGDRIFKLIVQTGSPTMLLASSQAVSSSQTVSSSQAVSGASSSVDTAVLYRHETDADAASIEAIHEEAFGPGRFARTAFRLREGFLHDPRLGHVAESGGTVVGSVRLTPIHIGETPALLLGPLAVRPHLKGQGIGKTLMRRSMDAARSGGHRVVLLVGDLPYYWPFGFRVAAPGSIVMPGPVDPGRLLVAELVAGASADLRGVARGG